MYTFIFLICRLINILELLIAVRCILSWIPGFQNGFTELIYRITEPFLAPVRNLIFRMSSGRMLPVDLSPIVLYIILELICRLLFAIF